MWTFQQTHHGLNDRPFRFRPVPSNTNARRDNSDRRTHLRKHELLNGLNNLLNTFLYGFMCSRLTTLEAWAEASQGTCLFRGSDQDIRIQLGPLSKRVLDPNLRPGLTRIFENSLLRAMIRESHELILHYCKETEQDQTYKAVPWFQFARILRNVVSHKEGGTLREWPRDLREKGVTSVRWRSRTFDTSMVGTPLVFYPHEGLELLKDQIDFVADKLS